LRCLTFDACREIRVEALLDCLLDESGEIDLGGSEIDVPEAARSVFADPLHPEAVADRSVERDAAAVFPNFIPVP
jgi:hypothetical protein